MRDIAAAIDARGLHCPLPTLKLRRALLACQPGQIVELVATDPAARADVPAFCAEAGHDLLALAEAEGVLRFTVRRGAG